VQLQYATTNGESERETDSQDKEETQKWKNKKKSAAINESKPIPTHFSLFQQHSDKTQGKRKKVSRRVFVDKKKQREIELNGFGHTLFLHIHGKS